MTFTLTADYLPTTTCPSSQSIILTPIQVPEAAINVTPAALNYDNTSFDAIDQSTHASTRQWYINGADYGDEPIVWYKSDMEEDTVEVLLISMSEQCSDTALRLVPVYRTSVYAPNAFTPDESTNREFKLFIEGVRDYRLTIYNRQGTQVFTSEDPTAHWDGTYGGKPCPQGNYVWILHYTTDEMPRTPQTAKGSVLLLR